MKRKALKGMAVFTSAAALLVGCAKPAEKKAFTLEKERIMLYVGEEETLRSDGGGSISGSFLSTAPETASVTSEGKIKALEVGSCVVVVRSEAGTAVCTVIVTGEAPIAIRSLKIKGGEEKLTAGESVRLEYEKEPIDADNYNSIRWSSSAPEIAAVDSDGVLTALSPGVTEISLSATGTDFKDSFRLEVAARPNRLDLNYTDVTGLVGTADLSLNAELFTDYKDVSEGVWESDDSKVATVENGEVRFVGVGNTVIRYKVSVHGEQMEVSCAVASVQKENYAVIRTPEQLQDIENTSGNYMLGNDIDLEEACAKGGALYHGGAGFSPLFSDAKNAFCGVFDGMGYSIKNLTIRSSNAFTAFISYLSVVDGKEGTIRNLGLDGGSVTGGHYSAALVGRCNTTDGSAKAVVENCFVNVDVSSFGLAAGLVGYNGGVIRSCISFGKVTGETTAAFALRQCDNAEIGIKSCVALEGTADCLVPDGKSYSAFLTGGFATAEAFKKAETWQGWDASAWKIENGSLPTLRTPNQR